MDQAMEEKFLEKFFKDKNFQKKLSECDSPEQALEIIKSDGFDVDLADFKTSMGKLNDLLKQLQGKSGGEELAEADLELVAGGKGLSNLFKKILFPGPINPQPFPIGPGPGPSAAASAAC